ncbi:hypothetical protein [Desulfolutivibrio sulfoxidireducens]|uniref:hypothetical protein n=1 Tax=Desulfolutivibrio sulfoxidireducens TaxID=2773299 RepID=UPI00159DDFC2|nr:hypothetical protein [Desulfolutivibrio sulfoxidireducens]QLA17383.1 hypothetical protein GD605_15460 [Desulfolutivibrio sulfoxidireducens]
MNFKLKFVVYICVMISSFGMSCSDSSLSDSDLSSIHDGFRGIKWGDNFFDISKKFVLNRTDFGGNDREPGYQVMGGMPLDIEGIPVDVYLQFRNNKIIAVHIHASKDKKDDLMDKFLYLYGEIKAHPSKDVFVWQDSVSTIAMQKNIQDGGCLFTLVNNDNYMKQTGRNMNYY